MIKPNKLPDGVLVDDEDLERVLTHERAWWLNAEGYVISETGSNKLQNRKPILLHRFIMQPEKHLIIDHKNHNLLDNRRCNLRVCTAAENSFNRRKDSRNKSGYKGVCFEKSRNKWAADIRAFGVRYRLGRFDTAEQARDAYVEAAKKLHGEWVCFE